MEMMTIWPTKSWQYSRTIQWKLPVKLHVKVCIAIFCRISVLMVATYIGQVCPFGNKCIYGHKCPKGPNCYHNALGKCWFKTRQLFIFPFVGNPLITTTCLIADAHTPLPSLHQRISTEWYRCWPSALRRYAQKCDFERICNISIRKPLNSTSRSQL